MLQSTVADPSRQATAPHHAATRRALFSRAGIALVALLALPAGDAGAKDKDPDWPEITQAERDFKSVPGDAEAGAVLLRNLRDGKIVMRGRGLANVLDYHWRLKVLTD